MQPLLCVALLCALVAGCADERIVQHSSSFYPAMYDLSEREVAENISETIDNPYRIPTRTTFGKATLTFTDNAQVTISVPLHLYGKTPGSVGGNIGQFTDTFALSLTPEINPESLADLRDLYRALVYPDRFSSIAHIPGKGGWLYWKIITEGHPIAIRQQTLCWLEAVKRTIYIQSIQIRTISLYC